jgi:hypothetical protein
LSAGTLTTSILQYGTNNHATTSEEANFWATDFIEPGISGTINNTSGFAPSTGAFAVNAEASPTMQVNVGASTVGQGAYMVVVPSTQTQQNVRVRMANSNDITLAANSSGSTKYDWIYIALSATLANNPDVNATTVATFVVSRSTSNSADNGGLTPTYGQLLAVVTVTNGAGSITNGNIQDRRISAALNAPLNLNSSGGAGWTPLTGLSLAYGSNSGNKEFTVTNGTDLTPLLSPGMKLQVGRSISPPTTCMSFTAASSQYASKGSPTGITFTAAFTCETWVTLASYTGQRNTIISMQDFAGTTGGWEFEIDAYGRVAVSYGSGSSFTNFTSYQSIPLNTKVHVAAVVTSTSSKTALIYINGVSVATLSTISTATALVQASVPLTIGAASATQANSYFDGQLSETRVWSVAQSSTLIQNNMAISIAAQANLVVAIPGSGNFNDISGNSNNLTSSGGAIATYAANPYNAIEYATILAVSYSSSTTITLDTGDYGTIPNQTLINPAYSISDLPFGFPKGLSTQQRSILVRAEYAGVTSNTILSGCSTTLTIPAGARKVRLEALIPYAQSGSICTWTFSFYNSATVTGSSISKIPVLQALSSTYITGTPFFTHLPIPGIQSYCLAAACDTGTGNIFLATNAPLEFRLTVE